MTPKKKSSKKPITKLSDSSKGSVKLLWIPVAGVIGAIILINQLVEIWNGNPTRTNYIIISVILAIWLIVLSTWTFGKTIREQKGFFSKKARLGNKNVSTYKLLSGAVLLSSIVGVIGGIVIFTKQKNEFTKVQDEKIIIVIANFDDGNDGKDLLDIHNSIVEQLRSSLANYKDTEVMAVDEVITVTQGSEYARDLGLKYQADLVLWGRYRADIEKPITIYIENLSPATFGVLKQSQTYKPTVDIAELKTTELRQNLGSSLSALINFLSGFARYKAGDYTNAITRFEQVLSEPEWANEIVSKSLTLFFIGASYEAMGDYNAAILYLTQSIELEPQRAIIFNARGIAHDYLKQYDEAMADYNRAIALDPQSAILYNNRGVLYDLLGQYDKAIADYTYAIELDPQYEDAYFNRGFPYEALKQYDKAIADYSHVIELNPQSARAYNNRGNIYFALNDYDKALSDLSQAIELNPQDAVRYGNRGSLYYLLEQYEKGIKDFTHAIEINPQNATYWSLRGIGYAALNKYDESITEFTRALELDPQDYVTYNSRGLAYHELKQYDQAIADFSRAIELNPNYPGSYNNRGLSYETIGKLSEAGEDFQKYNELNQLP